MSIGNTIRHPSRYRIQIKPGDLTVISATPDPELGIAMDYFHPDQDKFSEEVQVLCDFLLGHSEVLLKDVQKALRFSSLWRIYAKQEVEEISRMEAQAGVDYEEAFRDALTTYIRHVPDYMRACF